MESTRSAISTMYMCMYIYIYVYIYVCVYIYIYMYVCISTMYPWSDRREFEFVEFVWLFSQLKVTNSWKAQRPAVTKNVYVCLKCMYMCVFTSRIFVEFVWLFSQLKVTNSWKAQRPGGRVVSTKARHNVYVCYKYMYIYVCTSRIWICT